MVVSMLQIILEIPETYSLKDKRRLVNSIKEKLRKKFMLSCAEVDLQDSQVFAQLGAALVSNSSEFGEKVLNRAVDFVENTFSIRIHDYQIKSEHHN